MPTIETHMHSDFLNRFLSFNDAVVRQVRHSYLSCGKRKTSVTLSAQDKESEQGWSNVTLVVVGVSEMLFREGLSTRQVLSNGVYVKWLAGKFWCDFSPYSSDPETEDDFHRSDFYIVGESLTWTVDTYTEMVEPE